MSSIPICDLTDDQLAAEWHKWNDKIVNAKGWGASLAASNEFRRECELQINRRNIIVKGFNDNEGDKPTRATWFIPFTGIDKYPSYYKHKDGKYRPAPSDYIFEPERGGWTHPNFATPTVSNNYTFNIKRKVEITMTIRINAQNNDDKIIYSYPAVTSFTAEIDFIPSEKGYTIKGVIPNDFVEISWRDIESNDIVTKHFK